MCNCISLDFFVSSTSSPNSFFVINSSSPPVVEEVRTAGEEGEEVLEVRLVLAAEGVGVEAGDAVRRVVGNRTKTRNNKQAVVLGISHLIQLRRRRVGRAGSRRRSPSRLMIQSAP